MDLIFRDDSYARSCEATVASAGTEGIRLDRTVFYAQSGGQPGDTGRLVLADGRIVAIQVAVKGAGSDDVLHLAAAGAPLPEPGQRVKAEIDWERRYRLMRVHTAMHLLCSLIKGAAVTGGAVGDGKGRLDFDLPEHGLDKAALGEAMNRLIAADHPVVAGWMTDDELARRPELVRTMSVKPPAGAGRVRTIRIGPPDGEAVDFQPCGGTHVRRTGEIGRIEVNKIESKGRQNRRVSFVLLDP
ncbi:MAG: alanyl-tRNA editing protein [Proteobacteria bacterium]|nr:alanyl-tRNA editing protein [Pseudomonadota bacterium]